MTEIQKIDDDTYELTKTFNYSDGYRIIIVSGCKKRNKLEVEVYITPILKGRQGYVVDKICPDVEIVDTDIKIIDELVFSNYPGDVITKIKEALKEFWLSTV